MGVSSFQQNSFLSGHLDLFSGGKGQLHMATDGPGNVLAFRQVFCYKKVLLNPPKTREQPRKLLKMCLFL